VLAAVALATGGADCNELGSDDASIVNPKTQLRVSVQTFDGRGASRQPKKIGAGIKSQHGKHLIFSEITETAQQEGVDREGNDNKLGTLCRVRGKN